MRGVPYKHIPLEIMFVSAILGILLASRIYLFTNTGTGIYDIVIISISIILLAILFRRYYFPLCLMVSLTVFLFLLHLKEKLPSGEITIKGKITQFSENSFILKYGRVNILVHATRPTFKTFAVVKCKPEKMDLNKPVERGFFFRGITAKCYPKFSVIYPSNRNLITGLRENLSKSIPETVEGSIVKAIILGEKNAIPEHIRKLFIRTGTAHLLAISGIHFGTIVAFIFIIARKVSSRIKTVATKYNPYTIPAIISFPVILLYLFINLNSVSAIRSFIMTIIFTFSLISLEKFDLLNVAGASGFLMLSFNPFLLFSPSFQLSFSAIHFIIFCLQGIERIKIKAENPFSNRFFQFLLITLFAGVGTLPITISTFGYITWKGFIINLAVVPVFTVFVIPCSFMYVLLSHVPLLNSILWVASRYSIHLSLSILQMIDKWKFSMLFPPTMPSLYYLTFYLLPFILHLKQESLLKQSICVSLLSLIPISLSLYPSKNNEKCIKIIHTEKAIYIPSSSSLLILNLDGREIYKVLNSIKLNRISNIRKIYFSGNERAKIKLMMKLTEIFYIEEAHSIDGRENTFIQNMCGLSPTFKNRSPFLNKGG